MGYGSAMYTGLIRNTAQNKDQIINSNFNAALKDRHPQFLDRLEALSLRNKNLDETKRDSEPEIKNDTGSESKELDIGSYPE